MNPPNLKSLQNSVDQWNTHYPIGTPVMRYKLINPLREGAATKTRSEAWIMGDHSAVVKVEGIAGACLLQSVKPL